ALRGPGRSAAVAADRRVPAHPRACAPRRVLRVGAAHAGALADPLARGARARTRAPSVPRRVRALRALHAAPPGVPVRRRQPLPRHRYGRELPDRLPGAVARQAAPLVDRRPAAARAAAAAAGRRARRRVRRRGRHDAVRLRSAGDRGGRLRLVRDARQGPDAARAPRPHRLLRRLRRAGDGVPVPPHRPLPGQRPEDRAAAPAPAASRADGQRRRAAPAPPDRAVPVRAAAAARRVASALVGGHGVRRRRGMGVRHRPRPGARAAAPVPRRVRPLPGARDRLRHAGRRTVPGLRRRARHVPARRRDRPAPAPVAMDDRVPVRARGPGVPDPGRPRARLVRGRRRDVGLRARQGPCAARAARAARLQHPLQRAGAGVRVPPYRPLPAQRPDRGRERRRS
ncbi:MAG: hypothetical protein AVDCRST_MAG85-3258, partial [uncultured Solirubrobacteraceae bacterium]